MCEHPSHDVNLHHLSQTRNNRSIRRLSIEHSEYVYSVLYTALVRPVRQEASGPCPTTSCITQSSLVQMLIVHSILHRGHYLENEQDYGVNDGGVSGWRRPLRAFSLSNREWPEQQLCPVYKRTYRVRVQSMLKYAKVCVAYSAVYTRQLCILLLFALHVSMLTLSMCQYSSWT